MAPIDAHVIEGYAQDCRRLWLDQHPVPNHEKTVGDQSIPAKCCAKIFWPGKIREPDLMVCLAENRARIGEHVSGVPALIAEIISPDSRRIDRQDKFTDYAQANVAEYWLVDPDIETVE
ncbi:MAG: Uma2 family endonuclease, partial [Anaerolineae bacterium]|nr:Uma2 family endonuclease [Anaerolineae bacterium]